MDFTPNTTYDEKVPSFNNVGEQTPSSLIHDDSVGLNDIINGMFITEQNYVPCIQEKKIKCYSSEKRVDLSSSPVSVMQSFSSLHYDNNFIEDNARYEVCKWIYKVVDHYSFDRETAAIAMSYFDRMVWKSKSYSCPDLQEENSNELFAVTSLYIAVKLYEHRSKRSILADLVQMSRCRFVAEDITTMEFSMLKALSWHVHPTIPQSFVQRFLELFPRSCSSISKGQIKKVFDMSSYILELCLFDSQLAYEKPSTIATAAIIFALEGTDSAKISLQSQESFIRDLTSFGQTKLPFVKARMYDFLSYHHGFKLTEIRASIDPNGIFYLK